jgi:hypothetical protein
LEFISGVWNSSFCYQNITEFTEVLTEGTLSPSAKPTDWNVVITEKSLLEAMRTPSPPPKEI